MNKENKAYSKGKEIFRFIVTGILCALIDFVVSYFLLALFVRCGMNEWWANALSITCGFVVSVFINYLLSTYWVFLNVKDPSKSKRPLFILFFILLSAIGLLLSIGSMELCALVCKNAWGLDILNKAKNIFEEIGSWTFWGDACFWAYFISFVIKTAVGLIWNYFTRKYILYKAPKE